MAKTPKASKRQRVKMHRVMSEFKDGKLNVGDTKKIVKNRKQAIAIALSEVGLSTRKKK
jgi:hypothetical protein